METRDTALSRRAFAALLGGAALAAPVVVAPALGQAPAVAGGSRDGAEGEVEAKLARIISLYGDRLTAEQRTRVRRTLAGHVGMLEAVRAVEVGNADAPATELKLVHHD